jgi:hypothetical protein
MWRLYNSSTVTPYKILLSLVFKSIVPNRTLTSFRLQVRHFTKVMMSFALNFFGVWVNEKEITSGHAVFSLSTGIRCSFISVKYFRFFV